MTRAEYGELWGTRTLADELHEVALAHPPRAREPQAGEGDPRRRGTRAVGACVRQGAHEFRRRRCRRHQPVEAQASRRWRGFGRLRREQIAKSRHRRRELRAGEREARRHAMPAALLDQPFAR